MVTIIGVLFTNIYTDLIKEFAFIVRHIHPVQDTIRIETPQSTIGYRKAPGLT
jgi:hypothetical protein